MEDLRFKNGPGIQNQVSPPNKKSINIQDGSGKGNEIMNLTDSLQSNIIYNKQEKPYGKGTKEEGYE